MQRPYIRPCAYSILILLLSSITIAVLFLLMLLFHYCLCYKTVATDNVSRASLFKGAADLTYHLLKVVNILAIPYTCVESINLGFTSLEDCCDPLYLWVIKTIFLSPLPGSIALFVSPPECDIVR